MAPKADGPEHETFIERIELQPIDAQTNGPQLLYGLRYHTRIVKPGEVEAFHDQVGYWLWEPATGALLQTLSIPRGQTAMATGHASADATSFRLEAVRGSATNGILSNPFLEHAFKTVRYAIAVTVHPDGTLVVRAGDHADHPRAGGALCPHRSQHAAQGGRADPEPDRPGRAGQASAGGAAA